MNEDERPDATLALEALAIDLYWHQHFDNPEGAREADIATIRKALESKNDGAHATDASTDNDSPRPAHLGAPHPQQKGQAMSKSFTEEETRSGEEHPLIGAEYFAARSVAERFIQHFEAEKLEPMIASIAQRMGDEVREQLWNDVRDFMLSDTQSNIHTEIIQIAEKIVNQILAGDESAFTRHVLGPGWNLEQVRASLARLIPDRIAALRIAELERECERLRDHSPF